MAEGGTAPETDGVADKDLPLRDDIRLLGRLLGDTVRAQEGAFIFDIVETIRRTSIQFHRDDDHEARRALEDILRALNPDQAVQVIRAFSYFSHLANIAEDEHHIRRTRSHDIAGDPPRRGTIARALTDATDAGLSPDALVDFFNQADIRPVLTAHPTEVRRKSTMDREIAIAGLLDRRGRGGLTPEERREIDDKLSRAILVLWQTNLLRQTRLTVTDEVENGLSYYDYTFFRELPRLYAQIEDSLGQLEPATEPPRVKPFLRIGSWIGGDRDGNPFVDAAVLRETVRMQSAHALAFHRDELEHLRRELSLSTRLVEVSDELAALAARSPETSVHSELEPYRRAISLMLARLDAARRVLSGDGGPAEPP